MEIDTARARISFIDEGPADGPVVVLLHPFPVNAEIYRSDADVLSGTLRVLAPSMRGFGTSSRFDGTRAPSVDILADDVAAFLDALGVVQPVVLGGISMGGYVALAFARRHPARLRGLLLADTRAEPDTAEARVARERNIARVRAGDLAGFVEAQIPNLVSSESLAIREAIPDQIRTLALQSAPEAIIDALRALRDRPDARPDLPAIAVPTAVLVGEKDTLTPVDAAETLANAIPDARLEIVAGAGHIVNLEAPHAFREAVMALAARS